jgi:MbtH protein
MYRDEDEDTTIYQVVVNHEEQYSIWPVDRENPLGWRNAGKNGTRTECLAYIDEVWTDMRPLSLRKEMEQPDGTRNQVGEELPTGSSAANTGETGARLASPGTEGGV